MSDFVDLGNVPLDELTAATEEKVPHGVVGELTVEINLRILLRGNLKIQGSMNVLPTEGELMTANCQAEVIRELKGPRVDMREGAGSAESIKAVRDIDCREISGRRSYIQADIR